MLLTTPTFNIEILPNALAALPELFAGLDDLLPALDIQLEEVWSGEDGPATEVLITANVAQALADSRPIFLVDPNPNAASLANLLDEGRHTRWVAKNTPKNVWVDSFARFLGVPPRIARTAGRLLGQSLDFVQRQGHDRYSGYTQWSALSLVSSFG